MDGSPELPFSFSMRKPLKPKREIIQDLSQVFRAHGFEGASLSLLTKGTGLERASLYHHFPNGKADMAEAVLLQALADLEEEVLSCLEGGAEARAKVEGMLKQVEKFYKGGNEICFITIFSLGVVSPTVTEAMAAAVAKWLKVLERTLRELGVAAPKESAQQGLATIQGALVLAHTLQEPKLFKNALKQLKTLWLK